MTVLPSNRIQRTTIRATNGRSYNASYFGSIVIKRCSGACWYAWACCCCIWAVAQPNNDRPLATANSPEMEYVATATQLMTTTQPQYNEAAMWWKKAIKQNSSQSSYQYQLAYCHYRLQQYEQAASVLNKLVQKKSSELSPSYYLLLSSAYDAQHKSNEAVRVCQKGIAQFGASGELYNELGGLYYRRGDNDRAVQQWEQGVSNDPTHSSNYYWLALLYCHSSEKMWGLHYGELFINLEPDTPRTLDMSRLLALTYHGALHTTIDHPYLFSKTGYRQQLLESEDATDLPLFTAYETVAQQLLPTPPYPTDSLRALYKFRLALVQRWYEQQRNLYYNDILLQWQHQLVSDGHFEAYTYWLLRQQHKALFDAWLAKNTLAFASFINYMSVHSLQINTDYKFCRANADPIAQHKTNDE